MRILVCEDQDAIRHMIGTLVTAAGHEVEEVRTGAEAVELVHREKFDVLLLDLMLPGALDGFEVCKRIREGDRSRNMPIFVISAMDEESARPKAISAGATVFFSKPFRPLELLEDIQRLGPRPGSTPDK
ncbi:MAG: response regulator [Polyangiaceae bacterium]|nr:response regulator [Polyangiaceae bacterium]